MSRRSSLTSNCSSSPSSGGMIRSMSTDDLFAEMEKFTPRRIKKSISHPSVTRKSRGSYTFPNGEVFTPRNFNTNNPAPNTQIQGTVPQLHQKINNSNNQLPPSKAKSDTSADPIDISSIVSMDMTPNISNKLKNRMARSVSVSSLTNKHHIQKQNLANSLRSANSDIATNINPLTDNTTRLKSQNICSTQSSISLNETDSSPSLSSTYTVNGSNLNTPTTSISNSIEEGTLKGEKENDPNLENLSSSNTSNITSKIASNNTIPGTISEVPEIVNESSQPSLIAQSTVSASNDANEVEKDSNEVEKDSKLGKLMNTSNNVEEELSHVNERSHVESEDFVDAQEDIGITNTNHSGVVESESDSTLNGSMRDFIANGDKFADKAIEKIPDIVLKNIPANIPEEIFEELLSDSNDVPPRRDLIGRSYSLRHKKEVPSVGIDFEQSASATKQSRQNNLLKDYPSLSTSRPSSVAENDDTLIDSNEEELFSKSAFRLQRRNTIQLEFVSNSADGVKSLMVSKNLDVPEITLSNQFPTFQNSKNIIKTASSSADKSKSENSQINHQSSDNSVVNSTSNDKQTKESSLPSKISQKPSNASLPNISRNFTTKGDDSSKSNSGDLSYKSAPSVYDESFASVVSDTPLEDFEIPDFSKSILNDDSADGPNIFDISDSEANSTKPLSITSSSEFETPAKPNSTRLSFSEKPVEASRSSEAKPKLNAKNSFSGIDRGNSLQKKTSTYSLSKTKLTKSTSNLEQTDNKSGISKFFRKFFKKNEKRRENSNENSSAIEKVNESKAASNLDKPTSKDAEKSPAKSVTKETIDELTLPVIERDTLMFDDVLTNLDKFSRSSVVAQKENKLEPIFFDDELTRDQIEDQQAKDSSVEALGLGTRRLSESSMSSADYIDENILQLRNEMGWMDEDLLEEKMGLVKVVSTGTKQLVNEEMTDSSSETFIIQNEQLQNLFNNLTVRQRRSLPMHLKYIEQFKDFNSLEITIKTGKHDVPKDTVQPDRSTIKKVKNPYKQNVVFANKIVINETYSPDVYKRYNKSVTQYSITESQQIENIKAEMNSFKCNEMLVHESSQQNTHFFY